MSERISEARVQQGGPLDEDEADAVCDLLLAAWDELRTARAEIERLERERNEALARAGQESHDLHRCTARRGFDELLIERATLRARLNAAQEALRRYGYHETMCATRETASLVCDCGLAAALEEPAP